MATINNSFENCELVNLGYGPHGRGPFIIRQTGSPPGSVTFEKDNYLLRHDGTWVLNLAVFALSEKEQEPFYYESHADAMKTLDGLAGDPVVQSDLPAGKSREELKAGASKTFAGLAARVRSAAGS